MLSKVQGNHWLLEMGVGLGVGQGLARISCFGKYHHESVNNMNTYSWPIEYRQKISLSRNRYHFGN